MQLARTLRDGRFKQALTQGRQALQACDRHSGRQLSFGSSSETGLWLTHQARDESPRGEMRGFALHLFLVASCYYW